MRSRHSTPHHTPQPAREKDSDYGTRKQRPMRKSERPQDRHVPRDRAERTSQQDFPANHLPPTPRDSREPEKGPNSRYTPRSETGSPSPRSSPIPRSPSQNAERPNHYSRSPSVASSSDASARSVDTGDTSHSEYIPDSDLDTSAESADDFVDCSENESEVSVISAGTRREMAEMILEAAAQLPAEPELDAAELQAQAELEAELELAAELEAARVQVEAELEAAALRKECTAAYEKLVRIRGKIKRYKSKAQTVILACQRNPGGKS